MIRDEGKLEWLVNRRVADIERIVLIGQKEVRHLRKKKLIRMKIGKGLNRHGGGERFRRLSHHMRKGFRGTLNIGRIRKESLLSGRKRRAF